MDDNFLKDESRHLLSIQISHPLYSNFCHKYIYIFSKYDSTENWFETRWTHDTHVSLSNVIQVREHSQPDLFHPTAPRSPKWGWGRSWAKRYRLTATGTCNSTSRKPRTCGSTIIFRAGQASVCTRGGTRFLRTRSTISSRCWAVSRPERQGRPMLVSLYVPLPPFLFLFSSLETTLLLLKQFILTTKDLVFSLSMIWDNFLRIFFYFSPFEWVE